MRILIHDYSGHPFQVQLSRLLAARGHQVLHLYSGSISTPQGGLIRREGDPAGFDVRAISLGKAVAKYDYFRRFTQELAYARLLEQAAAEFHPDAVILSNTPIDISAKLAKTCRRRGVPWLFWLQDIYSVAIERYIGQKWAVVGPMISRYYKWRERKLLDASSAVVAISEGFLPIIEQLGGRADKAVVIENWAPLGEISPRARDNAWAVAQGLDDVFCFLYAGTLGLKHNPDLLLDLARQFEGDPQVRVVVVSEGRGADYLAQAKRDQGLANLVLLPWQPFDELPNVLATADVLMAILEPDAGVLSVPSKVLSNLAAGRPQLLAVPAENLAATVVTREQAGFVASPKDREAWLAHALRLRQDDDLRERMGRNARGYAERAFDIHRITDRFEALISQAVAEMRGTGAAR